MTGNRTSHITLSYMDYGVKVTHTYAITEDTRRELNQHTKKPTGKDLRAWLENTGCQLDSDGGPALVYRWSDGFTSAAYYRNGKFVKEKQFATFTIIPGVTIKRPGAVVTIKPKSPGAAGPA